MNYHHIDLFRAILILAVIFFLAAGITRLHSPRFEWRYFGIACLVLAFVVCITACTGTHSGTVHYKDEKRALDYDYKGTTPPKP